MDYLDDLDEFLAAPALYSRILILIYSLFLTPLGGVILMAINLISVRRRVSIIWLIIAFLLFEMIHLGLIVYFGPSTWTFFLPHVLGAILLAFPVWNILLKGANTYKKKSILVPIIVLLLIWVPLMILNFIDFTG